MTDTITDWMKLKQNQWQKYIKGKRVALIGPADTLKGKSLGNFFDSFDVVVRLNRDITMGEERHNDYGSRTDVLYGNCSPNPIYGLPQSRDHAMLIEKFKFFIAVAPRNYMPAQDYDSFWHMAYQNNVPAAELNLSSFRRLERAAKTRPNSGIIALNDLLTHGAKEVYLAGLSFYRTQYAETYFHFGNKEKSQRTNQEALRKALIEHPLHDHDRQLTWLSRMYRNNPHAISLDPFLKNLVEEELAKEKPATIHKATPHDRI